MKRSIAFLGFFLPIMEGSSPLPQRPVKRAKRIVQYSKSQIPSPLNSYNDSKESKIQESSDSSFWFVHADANNDHPDHVMKQILNKDIVYVDRTDTSRKAFSLRQLMLSLPSLLVQSFSKPRTSTTERMTAPHRLTLETNSSSSRTEFKSTFRNESFSNQTFYQVSSTANVTSNSTLSNGKTRFLPLRLRCFLSDIEGGGPHLTSYQRSALLQNILKPAMLAWSAALRVDRVIGNLTVDPVQLVDGYICGPGGDLPSIIVPTEHTTSGVPNTDFILYVNLAFAANQDNETSSHDLENVFNSSIGNYADFPGSDSTNVSYPLGNVSDTSDPSSIAFSKGAKPQCFGDYLAASSFCSTDQFDRPTAAIVHLCIDSDFFSASKLLSNIRLISHELGHALGFNIVSLAHFRRSDGTPYTERDSVSGEIPISKINCTGPVGQLRTGLVALPSSEVLQFRTVRGVRVAEVVTPSVRQVARNHFDCQDLPGAELESGEFLPLSRHPGEISCIGDHWERRLFKTDLMNPLMDDGVDFSTRFSTITLAYFADSGWYQVDLSRASLSAGWGRAAGCDFIEQTCVKADDGQVPSNFNPFFCNQRAPDSDENAFSSEIHGCTTDLTRKASCFLDQYEGELPPSYQYFNVSYGSNIGGADPFMDYCPMYAGFTNGLCAESGNEALIKVDLIERFGQRNSRCLAGRLSRTSEKSYNESDTESPVITSLSLLESTALCLPIACVIEDRTLRIQVDGVWSICHHKDELIVPPSSTSSYKGSDAQLATIVAGIVCPDPIRVCPTFFCQRDCLGTNRICNYNVGKCLCEKNGSSTTTGDYVRWNETSFINSNVSADNTSINESDVEICLVPNASSGNPDSFYEPHPSEDGGLPNTDSPLSDYYYKTERNLRQESSVQYWSRLKKGLVSGAGAVALLMVIICLCILFCRRRIVEVVDDCDNEHDNITSPTPEEAINPNKDKLMASVVVNLRMHDAALQGGRPSDPLANRDSETDLSMTDTEGTFEVPGSLYTSPGFSYPLHSYTGTIVDLASHDNAESAAIACSRLSFHDDIDSLYVDPLAPISSVASKPVVRRRRHMFSGQLS